MQYSNNRLSREQVLSRFFPAYQPVVEPGSQGLSGSSCIISDGVRRRVLRQPHDLKAPISTFLRQYRLLSRLPATLVPRVCFRSPCWMALEYCAGDIKSTLPAISPLAGLLSHLHHQPPVGWRITLAPLLETYWQQCDSSRRTPLWLRWHKRLLRCHEPRPLRLAPLHMDVHAGNIVHTPDGLRLIDWEYAGDGDIALELATIDMTPEARRQLITAYARLTAMNEQQLWEQVQRWRPWAIVLMAGWYERRWQQTGERQFITLADKSWRQLATEQEK